MPKYFEEYKKATVVGKVSLVITAVLSVAVIALSILGLTNVLELEITNEITAPMLGIVLLINGIRFWKTNKTAALFSVLVSVFVFFVTIKVVCFR